jgi:hypothetical protein
MSGVWTQRLPIDRKCALIAILYDSHGYKAWLPEINLRTRGQEK